MIASTYFQVFRISSGTIFSGDTSCRVQRGKWLFAGQIILNFSCISLTTLPFPHNVISCYFHFIVVSVTISVGISALSASDISIQIVVMDSVENSIMIESLDAWCRSTTGRGNNYVTAGYNTKNVRTKKCAMLCAGAQRWIIVRPAKNGVRTIFGGILYCGDRL